LNYTRGRPMDHSYRVLCGKIKRKSPEAKRNRKLL